MLDTTRDDPMSRGNETGALLQEGPHPALQPHSQTSADLGVAGPKLSRDQLSCSGPQRTPEVIPQGRPARPSLSDLVPNAPETPCARGRNVGRCVFTHMGLNGPTLGITLTYTPEAAGGWVSVPHAPRSVLPSTPQLAHSQGRAT